MNIDAGSKSISININNTTTTVSLDKNPENLRLPVRLINSVIISPYEEYSVNVSAGISKATVIFKPSFNLKQQIPLLMANSLINVHHHTITIPLYNPSPYPQYLSKGIILGTIRLSTDDPDFSTTPVIDHIEQQLSENLTVEEKIDHLIKHIHEKNQHSILKTALLNNKKPFDNSKPTVATTTLFHTINTKDNQSPPFDKQYPYYGEKKVALEKIIKELLAAGQISESHSQYKSPALLVSKSSGGHRLVMNYKRLNEITIKDGYDLPNMEETIQELDNGKNHYFSKLDLKSGFWQFPIDKKDRHKTAFSAFGKLYQWNVLPQGLKNAPPSFQRIMSKILEQCIGYSLVYLDDIIIYSKSFSEHCQHLQNVLNLLQQNNLQLNTIKCEIAKQEIDYLGHRISSDGIQPLNEKMQAILNLAEPKSLKQANEFVGSLAFYRKFIPAFARVAAPIHAVTNLTKANKHKFKWKYEQSHAFKQLKKLLVQKPLFLHFPDDSKPVILTTDFSINGISGVLQQEIEGQTRIYIIIVNYWINIKKIMTLWLVKHWLFFYRANE
ncbi:unnamed protein product [Didymodactylos carnosus]|uniref:Reverse transcriptase domain-containing protein n=1 Tax=Didymodactylos carnosus TaxID=1234261 RepID=A0A8S2UL25_9BILA|nr:unnamed protein product [Didymodactylos carnosus]